MTVRLLTLIVICQLLLTSVAFAAIEATQFNDAKTESRYQDLIAELRCLVCQNQNLADSDADLAKDLRRKTAEMLQQGASNQEVLDYMRERYGDFVLYRPPFNATTAILWLGPLITLLIACIAIFRTIKRRQDNEMMRPAHASNEELRIKARNLLHDTPGLMQLDTQDDDTGEPS